LQPRVMEPAARSNDQQDCRSDGFALGFIAVGTEKSH
jgi:hypothetical protein